MKRMLCLWFPNWPIQRLVVAEPTLRKTHLVLFRRDPRKGQLVAAASPLAMLSGAQIDMPISEVKQLMRHSGLSRQTWRPNHRLHPRDQHRQLAKQAVAMVSEGRGGGVSPQQSDTESAHRKPHTENPFYLSLIHI